MTSRRRSSRLASGGDDDADADAITNQPTIGRQKRRAPGQPEPTSDDSAIGMRTPQRNNKRVRFSDLASPSKSSGLTQHVHRTSLSARSSSPAATPSRRGKLLLSSQIELLTPPSSPFSDVRFMQFTPLRQTLTPRLQRRLRRSHLSEEQNEVLTEQRSVKREQQEQVQRLQKQITDLNWELEQQRQFGVQVGTDEQQRVVELEVELQHLRAKQAQHDHEMQTASPAPTEGDTIFDMPSGQNAIGTTWDDDDLPSSPIGHDFPGTSTPVSVGFAESSTRPTLIESGTHASLPDPIYEAQIRSLEQTNAHLKRDSIDARTAFNSLHSTLVQLGFAPDPCDEDIGNAVSDAIRSARRKLEDVLPGETVCGSEDGKQLLEELVSHVRRLIKQEQTDSQKIDAIQATENVLRKQFNDALSEKQRLNERVDIIDAHRTGLITSIKKLEDDLETCRKIVQAQAAETQVANDENRRLYSVNNEQDVTIKRLQAALNKYRAEISTLENIIGTLELNNAQKETELVQLKSRLEAADEALAGRNDEICRLRDGLKEKAYELVKLAEPGFENVTVRQPKKILQSQASDVREEECRDIPVATNATNEASSGASVQHA